MNQNKKQQDSKNLSAAPSTKDRDVSSTNRQGRLASDQTESRASATNRTSAQPPQSGLSKNQSR